MQRLRLALPVIAILLLGVLIYHWQSTAIGLESHAGSAPLKSSTSTPGDAAAANSTGSGASPVPAATFTGPVMQPMPDQERQRVDNLEPQDQAEQLMADGVKHFEGATDMIKARVDAWRGKIKKTQSWDVVELEARYSSDLRVRDAAIEIDLVMSGLDRNSDSVQRLLRDAEANASNRPYDFYMLGMLANRGVESAQIHSRLRNWAHDPDEETRFWAIEGLAFLGTDETIGDFLEVLRTDPSLKVRQRCGASLAKSGMLTREQRMQAVPGLIDTAADTSQDGSTKGWAFQTLHEITAESMGMSADAWRTWYAAHGSERCAQFHDMNHNWILGNS